MKGSEKQVEWASGIRAEMESQADGLKARARNEAALKGIEFILGIEHAAFWIDYRGWRLEDLLRKLVSTGLRIRGLEYADNAKMDKTGDINLGKID